MVGAAILTDHTAFYGKLIFMATFPRNPALTLINQWHSQLVGFIRGEFCLCFRRQEIVPCQFMNFIAAPATAILKRWCATARRLFRANSVAVMICKN